MCVRHLTNGSRELFELDDLREVGENPLEGDGLTNVLISLVGKLVRFVHENHLANSSLLTPSQHRFRKR